jgi:asparagine synthase (glutamine-hydrolysing)
MCGWAGVWSSKAAAEPATAALAVRMAATLAHRGPDDAGVWTDAAAGLALGFRRLAILDLSPEGHQPMASASGRYALAFNGEVYNFLELRAELEGLGHRFRGHSDTEVMLAAFEAWGVEASVPRFNGMFAFAAWDRHGRRLVLARDRLGVKPLYYGWAGGAFLCGSELKALRAYPGFAPDIDRGALALFLRLGYVPPPHSIYRDTFQLPPGALLCLDDPAARPIPTAYWSARQVAEEGAAHPFTGTEEQAVAELDRLLRDSVRARMVADVPLGAFLSGGIDSSTVVAAMQAESARPVKTFTVGFREEDFDEAPYARRVAKHLGTDHTEFYVSSAEATAVIPRLADVYDEPFADPSQIPTLLISQLARRQVTVALTGDGGDELFGGYRRYVAANALWDKVRRFPVSVRRRLARGIDSLPASVYRSVPSWLWAPLRRFARLGAVGEKVYKLAGLLNGRCPEEVYFGFVSQWFDPAALVLKAEPELPTVMTDERSWARLPDIMQRMMYLDTVLYLPGDILCKLDRASMAVGLEARVPLIDDPRLVQFVWRLPLALKLRDGQGKWVLRRVLARYAPAKLFDRPKMGFGVPVGRWLRGPLRDWAEALLDERRLREDGYFRPEPVRAKWAEHVAGKRDWQDHLWSILMFQAWLDRRCGAGVCAGHRRAGA